MEILYKDVKSVDGLFFQTEDIPEFVHAPNKLSYIIYLKDGTNNTNLALLHKFIRMFAMPYRMILLNSDGNEYIGFVLFWDIDDKEEFDSTMDWVSKTHSEWVVVNCQDVKEIPKITGFRIANNLFHARRLSLQGEML